MPPGDSPARLCLDFQRRPEDVFEPGYVAEAPLVRFVAYALRRRVSGWVRLRADRLTDLLNAHEELLLAEVQAEGLLDGDRREMSELLIPRRDLIAVHASGPRGDEALRRPTRRHPIVVQAGNFLIGGLLHAPAGVDPMVDFQERLPMVPLTDAWIEFWLDGRRRTDLWSGTLVVNREQAQSVRLVSAIDLAEGLLRPTVLRERAQVG